MSDTNQETPVIMYRWVTVDTGQVIGDSNSRVFAEKTAKRYSEKAIVNNRKQAMKVIRMPDNVEVARFEVS
jgi:hypothetical protein